MAKRIKKPIHSTVSYTGKFCNTVKKCCTHYNGIGLGCGDIAWCEHYRVDLHTYWRIRAPITKDEKREAKKYGDVRSVRCRRCLKHNQ